jgi:hypothetical protein
MPLRTFLSSAVLALICAGTASGAAPSSAFSGTWRIDPARSTNLAAWRAFDLTIATSDSATTLERRLGWGRRVHHESMVVPLDGTPTSVAVPYWSDNRHLGAYIGGDKVKQVRARLLDDGRILRVESDLTLETQQGERAVNILSDYHLSPDGQTLTLIEIRSTRSRPVVYVFRRYTP